MHASFVNDFSFVGKRIVNSLIPCVFVITTACLSPVCAQVYNSMKEEVNMNAFVNCEHVRKLFSLDLSMFDLGWVLDKCWHHGTTLDEINSGLTSINERSDIENYEFEDLYLPCDDVFRVNMTKLTSRLLQDFINCGDAKALDDRIDKVFESRFGDIIDVYQNGNSSVTIDEQTLVSCANFSRKIGRLCHEYGLTEDQWTRGFLRYNYPDKWAVEEDITEMSMTCDLVFKTKLYTLLYENPTEMFIRCQKSQSLESEMRDLFEKRNAEELKKLRAEDSPDEPSIDLRGFVSCKHLEPVLIGGVHVSASRHATDSCRSFGLTYDELQNATESRRINSEAREPRELDFDKLYLDCDSVFNANFRSFTSPLLNDYEYCKAVDKVSIQGRRFLWKKFADLFQLFATKREIKRTKLPEQLVRCAGFKAELADLCRTRGMTLAQELRGFGSLAHTFGNKWMNAEALERLYVLCEDLFDERYFEYTEAIPVDQYMHCRWIQSLDESAKSLIDRRIDVLYENKYRRNETRYRGDTDIEISSAILFN